MKQNNEQNVILDSGDLMVKMFASQSRDYRFEPYLCHNDVFSYDPSTGLVQEFELRGIVSAGFRVMLR